MNEKLLIRLEGLYEEYLTSRDKLDDAEIYIRLIKTALAECKYSEVGKTIFEAIAVLESDHFRNFREFKKKHKKNLKKNTQKTKGLQKLVVKINALEKALPDDLNTIDFATTDMNAKNFWQYSSLTWEQISQAKNLSGMCISQEQFDNWKSALSDKWSDRGGGEIYVRSANGTYTHYTYFDGFWMQQLAI